MQKKMVQNGLVQNKCTNRNKSAQKSVQNKKLKASQQEIKAPKNESNPKFYTTNCKRKLA